MASIPTPRAGLSPRPLVLPPRLLLRVLTAQRLPLGSRILVVGCGRGELISFLDEMSFDVDGVDDSTEVVAASRQILPRFEIRFVRLSEALPIAEHEFDLVLVQDISAYHGNLLDFSCRKATANMLASLKPNGRLVFIRRSVGGWEELPQHDERCWTRHLACFPGDVKVARYPDTWLSGLPRLWGNRHKPRPGYYTVTFDSPLRLLDQPTWQDYARRGLMTGQGACCDSALVLPQTSHVA